MASLLSKKMDVHDAASVGDLSALKYAIKRGEDVNSVDRVSWFGIPGLWVCRSRAEAVKICFC